MNLYTNSRRHACQFCAYKAMLNYVCGLKRTDQPAHFRVGGADHDAKEAQAITGCVGEATKKIKQLYPVVTYERELVLMMVEEYFKFYQGDLFNYHAVEQEFCVPFPVPSDPDPSNPYWHLAGKRDGIIIIDGELWLLERKTTAFDISDGALFWSRLRIDAQLSHYLLAAKLENIPIVGVVYDVIRKPTPAPYLATPPEKLARKLTRGDKEAGRTVGTGDLYKRCRLTNEPIEDYADRIRAQYKEDPSAWFRRKRPLRLDDELLEAFKAITADAEKEKYFNTSQIWPRHDGMNCLKCDAKGPCFSYANVDDLLGGLVPSGWVKGKKHAELEMGD